MNHYWVNKRIAAILLVALMAQACGGGFATNLRSVLAASEPLIDSLVTSGVIPAAARDTYIRDFEDLAQGATLLKENLDSCTDKPCRLDAVDKYQVLFWDVLRRGHFSKIDKLRNIQVIITAIIEAAKAYYAPAVVRRDGTVEPQTDKEIREGIEKLREAMKPVVKVAAIDCNAPRYSFIAACDEPPDLHPCETAHHRQTGGRFNVNCQQVKN